MAGVAGCPYTPSYSLLNRYISIFYINIFPIACLTERRFFYIMALVWEERGYDKDMATLMEYFAKAMLRKGPQDDGATSLSDPFNSAATTATGEDMVQSSIAPNLNFEQADPAENPVPGKYARELPILVGGREPLFRERLADDAYAALKRGDETKLAGLLKATGDFRGETES